MSSVVEPRELSPLVRQLGWDQSRGAAAMWLFVISEAWVFMGLFFAYYYLGQAQAHWPLDGPPEAAKVYGSLGAIALSAITVEWARRESIAGRIFNARLGLWATILLGFAYIGLEVFSFIDQLKTLSPTDDAYGSIFYVINTVHGAHLVLGMCLLGFAAVQPEPGFSRKPPHRAIYNAWIYWQFVVAIWWLITVVLLYVIPNAYPHG